MLTTNTNPYKWTDEIDDITRSFLQEFGSLSEEHLNMRPAPGKWSIAQNIEHLIVVNETYFPAVRRIREKTYALPWFARYGFITRFFGKLILDSVKPDRRRKVKTFSIWKPSESAVSPGILGRFEKHQFRLKQLIRECEDLLEKGTVISSPASRNIVYTLDTVFDIIVTHERRHFNQAKEVLEVLDGHTQM